MKMRGWRMLSALAFLIAGSAGAGAAVEITGSTAVGVQRIDFDSTAGDLDEDLNFNDPRVNLYFKSTLSDNLALNFGFWAANDWSHENVRGNDGNVVFDDAVELRAAFVTVKNLGGTGVSLKAGKVAIPYGHEAPNRTANGDNSKNDFISNSMLDIHGLDDGVVLSGSFEGAVFERPLTWEAALLNGGVVTDGNPAGTGGQARSNDDLSLTARLTAAVGGNLTVQASWHSSDQTRDGDNDALNVGSSFFVNAVQDAAANNKNLVGLVYAGGRQGGGYDRELWELSAKYDYAGGYLLGFWGNVEADTITAGKSREWNYWGLQGRYDIDENAHVAVRWNSLDPDYSGGALGRPRLISVAASYKLADSARVAVEWMSFDEGNGGFSNEATTVGAATADDGRNADADALTAALSVKF